MSVDPVVDDVETLSPSELVSDLFGAPRVAPGPFAPSPQSFGVARADQPSLARPLVVDNGGNGPFEAYVAADHYPSSRELFPEIDQRSVGFESRRVPVGPGGGTVSLLSGLANLAISAGVADTSGDMTLEVARPGLRSLGVGGAVFEFDLGSLKSRNEPLVAGDVVLEIDLGMIPDLKSFEHSMLEMALYTGCSDGVCSSATSVDSDLDVVNSRLIVNISESDAKSLSPQFASTTETTVLALAAGANSDDSMFSASKIAPLESYQISGNTGALQISYPVPAVATGGVVAPGMSFSYSSAAVDGLNSSINTQPGEVGLGWSLTGQGSITRALRTCGSESSGDRCRLEMNEETEAYSISFGQISSKLVPDSVSQGTETTAGKTWFRPETNPSWKVVRIEQAPFAAVDADTTSVGRGTLFVDENGGVQPYNTTDYLDIERDSNKSLAPNAKAVAIASTENEAGYWILDSAGKVNAFGVPHLGDCYTTCPDGTSVYLGNPIDLIVNPTNNGYKVITDTGQIYGFGSFAGLTEYATPTRNDLNEDLLESRIGDSSSLNRVVDATFTVDGKGIWVVMNNGQVHHAGTANNLDVAGDIAGNPVSFVGITPSNEAGFYYLADVKGRLFKPGAPSNPAGDGFQMTDRDIVAISNAPTTSLTADSVHLLTAGANSVQLDGPGFAGRTSLAGSPDYLKTYWEVFGPDGSYFRFGYWRDNLSGYRNESVRAVPVYMDGSDCYDELCNTAYQWDIDRAEDVSGNITNYQYKNELNFYQATPSLQRVYTRSSDLLEVVYARHLGISGGRPANEQDWRATGRIVFNYADRTDGTSYPDAPTATMDCGFGAIGTCALSPGFYTKFMLAKVTNRLVSADLSPSYTDIAVVTLNHSFPAPGSGNDVPKLWLDSLDYQSGEGPADDDGLIQFRQKLLQNRVNPWNGALMELPRIDRITNQLGGYVDFTYGQPDGRAPIGGSGNESEECYSGGGGGGPDPDGTVRVDCWFFPAQQNGQWVLWNKYVIEKTVRSQNNQAMIVNVGMPATLTTEYSYGRIWWHRSNIDCTNACNSWNDYRGVEVVTIKGPDGSRVQNFYFNGMDQDPNPSSGTFAHTRTSQIGTAVPDQNEFRGQLFESISYDNKGWTVANNDYSGTKRVSASRTSYVIPASVAGVASTSGIYQVSPDWQVSVVYDASGVEVGKTESNIDYDNYGRPWRTMADGDTAVTSDNTTTEISYFTDAANWILDRVADVRVVPGLTPGILSNQITVLSDSNFAYGPNGSTPAYGYYSNDGNGVHTTFSTSDPVSPIAVRTNLDGTAFATSRTEYDQRGRVSQTTDPLLLVTNLTYNDDYGYLESQAATVTTGDVLTTTYSTPPLPGVPHSFIGPDGMKTIATRDSRGRTTSIDYPGGPIGIPEVNYYYDIADSLNSFKTTSQTATGSVDVVQYGDGWGNPIQTQSTSQTSGNRLISTVEYDFAGRPLITGSPQDQPGPVGSGLVDHSWSSSDQYSTVYYQPRGQRVETYIDATTTVSVTVESDGLATKFTDELLRTRLEATNVLGQLVQVAEQCTTGTVYCNNSSTGVLYATTAYTYEVTGQLDTISGPDAATTTLDYDMAGRKTRLSDPDSSVWFYTYDAAGNLATQTATAHTGQTGSQLTTMTVDKAGRVIGVASGLGSQAFIFEPGTGRLSSSTSSDNTKEVTVTNTYVPYDPNNRIDGSGQLASTTWLIDDYNPAAALTASYTYNKVGGIATITYPEPVAIKETVTVGYDSIGQAYSLSSSVTGDLVSGIDRDWLGRMTRMTRGLAPDQLATDWNYSAGWQRLQEMKVGTLSAGVNQGEFLRTDYVYDKVGNITSSVDYRNSGQRTCYRYDAMNRLTRSFTTSDDPGCQIISEVGNYNFDSNWIYDGAGNITGAHGPGTVDPSGAVDETVQSGNNYGYTSPQPHAVTSAPGRTFTYDFQGRQNQRIVNGVTNDLSYNGLGQLNKIKDPATNESDLFWYDAAGTRVKRSLAADGTTTYYLGGLVEIEVPYTSATMGAPLLASQFAFAPRILLAQAASATLSVLLVSGSTSPPNGDVPVKDRLVAQGHTVTIVDDNLAVASDADGKDLVIIASSVVPATLAATFKDVTVPILTWESRLFDDMGFVAAGDLGSTSTNQTQLTITDPTHAMAAGFGAGAVTVSTGGTVFDYGKPVAAAMDIATVVGDSTQVVIFGYETGVTMANSQAAPARRVGLWMSYSTPTTMTSNGWALFDAALTWATNGVVTNQPPSVNSGVDQTLVYGTTTTNLDATVTDTDGPSALTYSWSLVTKPAGAADPGITTPTAEDTGITGLDEGTYVFKLTANDGELDGSNTVTVTVQGQNTAPTVNAGPDQTVASGTTTASLDATVTDDDGLPSPPALTYIWSEESVPGGAATTTIDSPSTEDTSISGLSVAGAYVYKLTVDDGELSASSTVTIFVDPPAAAETPDMVIRKHYSLGGVGVATRTITDYPSDPDTDVLQWVITDHLGSTTNVVDQNLDPNSQNKTWYFPYGDTRGTTGSDTGIDQGFTGQTNDPGTGLIHYNARQYDPVVGRFIQQDTIVPDPTSTQDLNRYMYVRGNPISLTDPSGNDPCAGGGGGCFDQLDQTYGPGSGFTWDLMEVLWDFGQDEWFSRLVDRFGGPQQYGSFCDEAVGEGKLGTVCEVVPFTSCADLIGYEQSIGNGLRCGADVAGGVILKSIGKRLCKVACEGATKALGKIGDSRGFTWFKNSPIGRKLFGGGLEDLIPGSLGDDIVGLSDDYIDITTKGSRVRNVQTSVGRSSFEQELVESGFNRSVLATKKNVVQYELDGARYVVRDFATSTGGPTADFYPVGSEVYTLKIRLGGS